MVGGSNHKGGIPQPLQYSQEGKCDSSRNFQHNATKCVTPRVREILIKSLKLQLSLKARANQVVVVGNQNSKSEVQNSEIQVLLVWTDCLSQQILDNY
jgi:hypothetical protein